jgi:catechol 2,3-dioxygenase-like lactoylglutathione lyase family enzyme
MTLILPLSRVKQNADPQKNDSCEAEPNARRARVQREATIDEPTPNYQEKNMIGYVTVGANDIEAQRGFYSALVATIGGKELMRMDEGFTMYGMEWGQPGICVTPPYNKLPATPGNGTMTAVVVDDRAKVDALHAKALELGGSCEGPPGVRGEEGPQAFYGAYFRDPEGNKLCAFRVGAA